MEDRKSALDRSRLKNACFNLASTILQERRPINVERIQELADKFNEIAAVPHLEDFILSQDRDPNLVIAVIEYLEKRHALPMLGDDIRWFEDMFTCLVELACPNCAGTKKDEEFFSEIEAGIAFCRTDYLER